MMSEAAPAARTAMNEGLGERLDCGYNKEACFGYGGITGRNTVLSNPPPKMYGRQIVYHTGI